MEEKEELLEASTPGLCQEDPPWARTMFYVSYHEQAKGFLERSFHEGNGKEMSNATHPLPRLLFQN